MKIEPGDVFFPGGRLRVSERMLTPSRPREVLARILTNLQGAFIRERDVPRAIRSAERIMLLQPKESRPYRDRGLLLYEAEDWRGAIRDLQEYLTRDPAAADSGVARQHLANARARLAHLS